MDDPFAFVIVLVFLGKKKGGEKRKKYVTRNNLSKK
jgi:hypothetical protein